MKRPLAERADLVQLVEEFYSGLLEDDLIGFIFTDIAQLDLKTHLPKIVDFWDSLLFGTQRYKGQVMQVHIDLNAKAELKPEFFERWLQRFTDKVDELFEGEKADEILKRVKQMGVLMEFKVKRSTEEGFIQ